MRLIMSLVLCYCERCGKVNDISENKLNNLKNVTCTGCGKAGYLAPVPEEYLNNSGRGIKAGLHDKFETDVIKASSNFDQECWDRRVEMIYNNNRKLTENYKMKQSSAPKCPTCQSANIKKISAASKITNTALFGLLGTKRYKTFHCNNCGYEW